MRIKELLESHETFYTKRLQSNGYYPIDKYIWDDEAHGYRMFAFKKKDWGVRADLSMLQSILENNPFLISTQEFIDENHYGDEEKTIVS